EGGVVGVGGARRTAAEMAEWLRRLGDLKTSELEGPMAGFLDQLQAEGLAQQITLPRVADPLRWVLTEETNLYHRAFGEEPSQEDAAAILSRYLQTHALVALDDILARYPLEREWARRQLEEWARQGRAVIVCGGGQPMQFSAPANLQQVQRGSLGLLRREVITCAAPQFADFLLR